jgi:hypothetical protein
MRMSWIGFVTLAVALSAMAVDHLLGTDREEGETGLADPATFAISAALCLLAAALLFGWLVPRTRRAGPGRAAVVGLACSVLSVLPGIGFVWLGFPFVVAGSGIELGLDARQGARRRLALVAVALGSALVTFGAVAYAYAAVDGITEL